MRLDRSITLWLVRPFRYAMGAFMPRGSLLSSIPILMYHSISDEREHGVAAYYHTNTSPDVFRQHMRFLAAEGYQTVSLESVVDSALTGPFTTLHGHAATSSRLVVITFDDAFHNFYTEAFPALQEHGFTATVFLPTAFIGDDRRAFRPSAIRSPSLTKQECLTWAEVTELRRHGIHFGSHTVNHPKLIELDWPAVKSEISDSKSTIEQRLGEPVTSFCYPFAFPQSNRPFVETFTAGLRETGYRCCATTKLGRVKPGDDPYCLKRLPANSLDDAGLFAAKLKGAYDWLAAPQFAGKILKGSGRFPGLAKVPASSTVKPASTSDPQPLKCPRT
jgi:peptidoglycan/xylan/chitin deacetylase (PgdA/CDA1 family)